jgi:molybdopterin synthase catalytic subunit
MYKHTTFETLSLDALLKPAHGPMAGGVVLFSGEVRNHHKGKDVLKISYEAHQELADVLIAEIIEAAIQKYELHFAAAIHRLGDVAISESAVVVVTAHSHRQNAYDANQYLIDRIKSEAPIWKKEIYTDGSYYWGVQ